jgi:hypothetical protein
LNKIIDKIIDSVHKKLVDVEASVPGNNGNRNDPNHPANWDDNRFPEYAKQWIREFARVVRFRDSDKTGRTYKDNQDLIEKLASLGFEEEFLQYCVRYQTQIEHLDSWLKQTSAQRYQRKKKYWQSHDCSVWKRYGNWYNGPPALVGCAASNNNERGVCIPECEYYPDTGSISDEEVLSWYYKEIGDRTYEQLKDENSQFIQRYTRA